MTSGERKLVFISHANPEDNEFTRWLAARLTSLGYLVWADVTQLFGAEKFWRNIEDAIRNHAVKVIVVLSRVSQTKDGVLNEIHTALAVEKKGGLDRFIIPIKIDDLPSTDITSVLIQKNYINFHRNWAEGLGQLTTLFEKDSVPHAQTQTAQEASQWIDQLLAGSQKIVQEPQPIVSNWFSIESLPDSLNFFRVPVPTDQLRSRFESFPYPVYPYQDMIATFADEGDINGFLPHGHVASRAYCLPLHAILHNEPHSLPTLEWPDISRMLSYLIRNAWDNAMKTKDLRPYQMANGWHAWYLIDGYNEKNTTPYADIDGVSRYRKLVGHSEARNVYWHFAVAAHPIIGREPHLILKAHIPFSEDGKVPLTSTARMHSLRRSFCRSWWNDRWRDLLLAYATQVSDVDGGINLPAGSEQVIRINSRPLFFESPVSVKGVTANAAGKDESDEELDQLADLVTSEADAYLEEEPFDDADVYSPESEP